MAFNQLHAQGTRIEDKLEISHFRIEEINVQLILGGTRNNEFELLYVCLFLCFSLSKGCALSWLHSTL